MTDDEPMDELEIVRRQRPPVPAPSPEGKRRARAALEAEIGLDATAGSARTRRRPAAWAVAAVAAAAVVAAVVVGIGPARGPTGVAPAAAVEITRDGDHIEIRFLDLTAGEAEVTAAIQDSGLDIAVDFVAVSPSLVGTLVASRDTQADGDDVAWEYSAPAGTGAPAAVRVPATYAGSLALTIGRPAHPAESYAASAVSAELPGEPLHCGEVALGTASHARQVAAERGVVIRWVDDASREQLGSELPDAYRDWFVVAATPLRGGEVMSELRPNRPDDRRTPAFLAALRSGC